MEQFLLNTDDYKQHYSCNYSVDNVPFASRQKITLSIVIFIIGAIEIILYIPCLIAIWKRLEYACYKFMFVMGVLDVLSLFIYTIVTAVLGIVGSVYCSAPSFNYALGAVAMSLWICESSVEILLAVNRCVEFGFPHATKRLFQGWRVWLWMMPPLIYGLYTLFFEKHAAFSAIYFAWFMDPHVGYFPMSQASTEYYRSEIFVVQNWIIMLGLSGTYGIFGVLFANKSGAFRRAIQSVHQRRGTQPTVTFSTQPINGTSRDRRIFTQVILISLVNGVPAFTFLCMEYMHYTETREVVLMLGAASMWFLWSQAHGIPPFIYLLLNRTIRSDCAQIANSLMSVLGCKKIAVKIGLASGQSNTNNSSSPKRIFSNRMTLERKQNG